MKPWPALLLYETALQTVSDKRTAHTALYHLTYSKYDTDPQGRHVMAYMRRAERTFYGLYLYREVRTNDDDRTNAAIADDPQGLIPTLWLPFDRANGDGK